MSFLCEKCSKEFEDHDVYKQHRSTCGGKVAEKVESPPAIDKPEIKNPIVLRYEFKGDCPDCGRPISTLELDVSGKFVVMAYCVFCKRQFESREVASLDKDGGGKRL